MKIVIKRYQRKDGDNDICGGGKKKKKYDVIASIIWYAL